MPLVDKMKDRSRLCDAKQPVWDGPESRKANGGVSQSLIGRFLGCRERFRLYSVEGLTSHDKFVPAMEFGNYWHLAEEVYGATAWQVGHPRALELVSERLVEYCHTLAAKYPIDVTKISHWYNMCVDLFSRYVEYWAGTESEHERENIFTEWTFCVPYRLPWSGRTVYLRGKQDGLDLRTTEYGRGLWLMENKSKSQVDQQKVSRQLKFDLQTMMYLVALQEERNYIGDNTIKTRCSYREGEHKVHWPVHGVWYNVVKRSTHKTPEAMLKKVDEDIEAGRGSEWFGRWLVPISQHEIDTFKRECLNPVLEWLCVWWEYVNGNKTVALGPGMLQFIVNYRHPHGVYNPVDEAGVSEYDEFLESGSMAGLRQVTTLFPELEALPSESPSPR